MRFSAYVPTLVVWLLLAGCGGKQDGVVVHKEVRVVDAALRERLQDFALGADGAGTLRFAADAPGVAALEPGRVLVSEPAGDTAPHGFLQRIRSKRTEGGSIVFETEQVTLEEVFEQADIVHEVQLKPEQLVASEIHYPGIQLQPMGNVGQSSSASRSFDFNVSFDKVLIDVDGDEETVDDQLRIDGSFKLSAGVEMKIKIGTEYLVVPTVEHLRFLAKLEEAVELNLTGTLQDTFEKEIEVANFTFGAITVFVGPVPVVFSVSMSLSVGATGEISASLKASASQSVSLQVGAEYKQDGGWKNLSGFDSTFDVPKPELSLSGKARAFARPELAIAVYGIGGPTAAATAFAELDVELFRDPFWEMTGGMDLAVGLKAEIPVIGKKFDWSEDFELFRRSIGVAPNEAPKLELLSPEDGLRITEGTRLDVAVRASDREQEQLTVTVKSGGQVLATAQSVRGEDVVLQTGTPCPGTHTYEVAVTDAKGATTTERFSVVVENHVPEVRILEGSLEDWPVNPGGYLLAFATASDRSCSVSGNSAAPQFIQWHVNGQLVGHSDELAYALPPNLQVGSTLTLQAFYDDGHGPVSTDPIQLTVTAYSGNTSPRAIIHSPVDQHDYWISSNYSLAGRAIDPGEGILGTGAMTWTFRSHSTGQVVVVPGDTASFMLSQILAGQGSIGGVDVSLSVENSAGTSHTSTITVFGRVVG